MPTLLIEGKVCAYLASSLISRPTFLIRAYPDDDNVVVAQSYVAAAAKLGYPNLYLDNLLARSADAMRKLGNSQGENVIRLGKALRDAKMAVEKVRIAAELNEFCSQELGGITFMSEDVHQVMGGVGMIPGTCACLSLFIPHTQLEEDVIPVLSEADAGRFADMVLAAAEDLSKHLPKLVKSLTEFRSATMNSLKRSLNSPFESLENCHATEESHRRRYWRHHCHEVR